MSPIALVTAVATADDSGATSSGDMLPAILKGQATKPTAHDTQQLSLCSRLYSIRVYTHAHAHEHVHSAYMRCRYINRLSI